MKNGPIQGVLNHNYFGGSTSAIEPTSPRKDGTGSPVKIAPQTKLSGNRSETQMALTTPLTNNNGKRPAASATDLRF